MKKTKKQKNNPLLVFERFFSQDFSKSRFWTDFFLGFLFLISALYGALIWLSAEKIAKESYFSIIVMPEAPSALEKNIRKMTSFHPIERMSRPIAKRDPQTAAFLLAIAKKESNWGKYSPKKDGKDCFNYWGFRGSQNPTQSGYSCFDTPEEAVEVVGKRISELIIKKYDTPEKMVVWKCGRSCEAHSPESVRKWISDVGYYYRKLQKL